VEIEEEKKQGGATQMMSFKNLNRDRAALSLEMVRVTILAPFDDEAMLMRQCVLSKECVCEHGRLTEEGIDHRSELFCFDIKFIR
jgi:hypothetical protein